MSRSIFHHTTKYDGSLHYRFPAGVVERSEHAIAIYHGTGVPQQSYRGDSVSNMHALQIFFATAHHNITIAWGPDWTPWMHYVNIATPAEWNDRRVSAIDLDLDLILRSHESEVIVDDEDEFALHIERFGYSPELVSTCRREVERVKPAMRSRNGVFSLDIYDWRPGDDLDPDLLLPV